MGGEIAILIRGARFLVAVCLASLAVNLAMETNASSDGAFDVGDLSFLIPPSERSIRVAGNPGGQPILSRRLFMKFDDFIKKGHPDVKDPCTQASRDWVSVRPMRPSVSS